MRFDDGNDAIIYTSEFREVVSVKRSTSKPFMSAFERAGLVSVDQTILSEEMGSLSTGMKLYPTDSLPRKNSSFFTDLLALLKRFAQPFVLLTFESRFQHKVGDLK